MSTLSFLLAIISGSFNGAYTYHLKASDNKHLSWIVFGSCTFLILPLVILLASSITDHIFITFSEALVCLLVGFAFGIGMFLFTRAVELIGVGIPFALNISLGTLSGGLFSIYIHQNASMISHLTLLAYGNFILAIYVPSL